MKIERAKLVDALGKVVPGLAKKPLVEYTDCFCFNDGQVITFNDKLAISHPIEVGFDGIIDAKTLLKLLKEITTKEITLLAQKDKLVIEADGGTFELVLVTGKDLPIDEVEMPEDWYELPEKFSEAAALCRFSVGNDILNFPALTCLCAVGKYMYGCDRPRMTKFEMDGSVGKNPLVFPAFAAKAIADHKPYEWGMLGNWLHFANEEDTVLSVHMIVQNVKYPIDTAEYVLARPSEPFGFPDNIKAILQRSRVFCADKESMVRVTLLRDEIKIESTNAKGKSTETAECKYSGEELSFKMVPQLLMDILKKFKTASIAEKHIKFCGENFEHATCIIPTT